MTTHDFEKKDLSDIPDAELIAAVNWLAGYAEALRNTQKSTQEFFQEGIEATGFSQQVVLDEIEKRGE